VIVRLPARPDWLRNQRVETAASAPIGLKPSGPTDAVRAQYRDPPIAPGPAHPK